MVVTARATVFLGTWPPPTIELHPLLGALNESTKDPDAPLSTAYQHLNQIDLTFAFDRVKGTAADTTAQKVVHHAMAQVYDGPITVTVDCGQPPRPANIDLRTTARPRPAGPAS